MTTETPEDQLSHLRLAAQASNLQISDFVLPEEHDVILRRMRFHYLDWGTTGQPAIVFLHGGGLTAHTWDLVCLALRQEYHCLALDQRGHGDSEWSPELDYSLEANVRDVEAFVDYLGLEQFLLVGQSMGGLNAIWYASHHSDRLAGLVIVDVGPNLRTDGGKRILDFMMEPAELDSVEDFVERALAFNPRRDPQLLRRTLLHNLRRLANGKWTWKYDRRHRIRVDLEEMARRRQLLWHDIPRITCAALVVRGERSDVFLDEDAEKLARSLPEGRWVRIERAGHTVQGDNPSGLVIELRRFLREIGV